MIEMQDPLKQLAGMEWKKRERDNAECDFFLDGQIVITVWSKPHKKYPFIARAIGQLPRLIEAVPNIIHAIENEYTIKTNSATHTTLLEVAAAIRGPQPESEPESDTPYYDKIIEYGNRKMILHDTHGYCLNISILQHPCHRATFDGCAKTRDNTIYGLEDACRQGVEWLEKCGLKLEAK